MFAALAALALNVLGSLTRRWSRERLQRLALQRSTWSSAFRCQPARRNGLQTNSAVAPQRSAGAFYLLLLSPPASQTRTWP